MMAWEVCFLMKVFYTKRFTHKIQGPNMTFCAKNVSKCHFNHLLFTIWLYQFVFIAFRTKFCRLLQIGLKMPLKSCNISVLDPEISRSAKIKQICFENLLVY